MRCCASTRLATGSIAPTTPPAPPEAERAQLRADLKSQTNRQRALARDLDRRVDVLEDVPKQVEELVLSIEQLRGRAEGPERAWSRAEAMFLLEWVNAGSRSIVTCRRRSSRSNLPTLVWPRCGTRRSPRCGNRSHVS